MRPKNLALGLSLLLCTEAVAAAASTVELDTTLTLHVEVGSRMYTTWREQLRVRLGETFYLGDSEYTARIDRFLPDFRIVDGEFITVTQQLANPAARVIVFHDTTATDSTWAFLNFPPHFSPRSFFTFKLLEIQGYVMAGGSAVAADSSAAPPSAPTPALDKPKDAQP